MHKDRNATSRGTRRLLTAAVGTPILYFGTLLLSPLFFPGYSHITQYASELGSAAAPCPAIFNTGMMLTGAAGLAAGWGFAREARALSTGHSPLLPVLAGLSVSLFSAAILIAAIFPMPDPRHGAFGLGMAVQLAPFFLASAIPREAGLAGLRRFLVVIGLVMLGLFAIMMGVGALVTRANVGLFQRAYALTTFPWMGIAGYVLLRRNSRRASQVLAALAAILLATGSASAQSAGSPTATPPAQATAPAATLGGGLDVQGLWDFTMRVGERSSPGFFAIGPVEPGWAGSLTLYLTNTLAIRVLTVDGDSVRMVVASREAM
jgi:hypothetical membrane protein